MKYRYQLTLVAFETLNESPTIERGTVHRTTETLNRVGRTEASNLVLQLASSVISHSISKHFIVSGWRFSVRVRRSASFLERF